MIQNAPQVYIDLILKMFNKILGHVPRNGVVDLSSTLDWVMYQRNGVVDLSHQSMKREVNLIQIITGEFVL